MLGAPRFAIFETWVELPTAIFTGVIPKPRVFPSGARNLAWDGPSSPTPSRHRRLALSLVKARRTTQKRMIGEIRKLPTQAPTGPEWATQGFAHLNM